MEIEHGFSLDADVLSNEVVAGPQLRDTDRYSRSAQGFGDARPQFADVSVYRHIVHPRTSMITDLRRESADFAPGLRPVSQHPVAEAWWLSPEGRKKQ